MGKDIAALCAALADEVDFIGMPMRNLVVGLVELGQIVPDEAEAWARETSGEPFAREPELAKFDPMARMDWTLAMATAWIVWRTSDAVRRVWGSFLQECTLWEWYEDTLPRPYSPEGKVHVVGFKLRQPALKAPSDVLRSATVWTAMAKASPAWCRDPPLIHADRAERELRDALRAGQPLVARHGTMADRIDRHVWGSLSPFDDGRGGPEDVCDHGGVVRFHRARVERDAVLALWAPIEEQPVDIWGVPPAASMPTGAVEEAVVEPEIPEPTRHERIKAAAEQLPSGLSKEIEREGRREYPFWKALEAGCKLILTREEVRKAERFYSHAFHVGRPRKPRQ